MKERLKALIQEQIQRSFVPEYRAQATEEEALGIMIAHYFEWDGLASLRVAFAALEDSNFHKEAAKVQELIDTLRGDGK